MTVVGEAFVVIRPDDDKFAQELGQINLTRVGRKMSEQLSDALDTVGADLRRDIEAELGRVPDELDVGVRVNANTAEASSALRALEAQGEAARIDVPVDVDADPLLRDIERIQQEAELAEERLLRIGKAGDTFVGAGQKLAVGLTLPLILLGKQAVGIASDVETTLAQTIGLAGGTAEQVDQANAKIRELAGETGKSLTDLSEALLAVFSAGFTGEQAFSILEASARAGAAGLGETREVAQAVTGALAAYGTGVLTAADATDILVNTVKEGKAEAADLAPQFGRLLPIASELGISFNDVGASLAYLTRISGDASQSATGVAGIFNKLLKPTQQGAEALLAAGFSAETLKDSLGEQGLLPTLLDVKDGLDRTGGSLGQVFEDAEGFAAVLALTRNNGADAATVFEHLADSVGQTDAAFAAFDETKSADLAKASAEVNVALADFGNVVLPVLAEVLGFAAEGAELFSKLPGPLQTTVVAAVGLAAALGPVLIIGGKIFQSFGTITAAAGKVGSAVNSAFGPASTAKLVKFGAAAAGIAIGIDIIQDRIADDQGETEEFLGGIVEDVNAAIAEGDFDALAAKFTAVADARNELAEDANRAIDPFKRKQLTEAVIGLDSILAAMDETAAGADDLAVQLGITREEALQLGFQGADAIAAFTSARADVGIDVDPIVAAREAMNDLTLAFLRGTDTEQQFAEVSALTNIPVEDLHENLGKLADQARELGDAFAEGLGGVQDAFATTFGDEAKDSVDAFLDNFAKQTADAAAFTINLQKLIARGATDLASTFANQGVGAAGLAAEAAAASDAALADMETRFDFIALQEDTAEARVRGFATRITDGTIRLVEEANQEAENLFGPQVAETVGPRLAAALAQGDEAFFAELDAIAAEARLRSIAIGEGVGEGTQEGLENSIAAIRAAAQAVVDATLGVFGAGFKLGSPSRVMMQIGGDVAAGFNIGLAEGLVPPDLSEFTRALPTATQAAGQALSLSPPFGASPAILGASPGTTTIEFSGDIVVPVPPGASPREQADLVGRQVTFALQGSVG